MNNQPIYILGNNALAYYLGTKFLDSGERVIILTDGVTKNKLNTQGIQLKDGLSLKKRHYKFETALWTKEEAKLLLITSFSSNLHSDLSALTPSKVNNSPIICLTLRKDVAYLRDIFGGNFSKGTINSWIKQDDSSIIAQETKPEITIYSPLSDTTQQQITALFQKTDIQINISENENMIFWKNYIIYTAASLLTAAFNQTLTQTIKNNKAAYLLNQIVEESCKLATSDGIEILPQEIIESIYNIPSGYEFPLLSELQSGNASELNNMSTLIQTASKKINFTPRNINNFITHIYNIYLSIT